MKIQVVSAYKVGELVFPTIQEAQNSELAALFDGLDDGSGHGHAQAAAAAVVAHTDEVVAILTCQPKPKAPRKPRSDIGTNRAPKDTTAAAL